MVTDTNPVIAAASSRRPRFAFMLQPEFPMNALIMATEALRIANQNSGQYLFEWIMISIPATRYAQATACGLRQPTIWPTFRAVTF